jgi:hypothetical protein
MKKIIAAACLVMSFFATVAQEVEFPLSSNPVIKEYLKKNVVKKNTTTSSSARMTSTSLSLPFQDDFAEGGVFPRTDLWEDSDAFVNQTMCDHPVTIGVATLDGINKLGEPHDSLSTSVQPVICDYLTSKPIDLSTATAADSVYFSFFYQPQGLGDEPEDGDSLVLQFYASDTVDTAWTNVWSTTGKPDTAFQQVRIKIDNALYFWEGFKFRFYNYATPNGNRDHWNLDYINLDKNQTYNQPLYEITLANAIPTYLQEFTAMPYSHYKDQVAHGINPVKAQMNDTIRVHQLTGASASATLNFTVTDRLGVVQFNQSNQNLNLVSNVDESIQVPLTANLFPSTNQDFADFFISHQMSTVQSGWTKNDTSYMTQHFYNYYAYDDGTAESATGVHVANTKYAYQFDVKKEDSLIGISIYFNPWGKNVHTDLFSLCMWDNINVANNTDVLVYQMFDQKPTNIDSINGFYDYYLDSHIPVSAGTHYFGIIQSSVNEIGIGVDHNIDSHSKMFLNYYNQWYHSTINGSWMMRPMFDKINSIGIDEIDDVQFDVFPNPASTEVFIETSKFNAAYSVSVYNMIGEQLLTETIAAGQTRKRLDVSKLPGGIYFVQLANGNYIFPVMKKLVVAR